MTLRASKAEARARHGIASERYRREQTLRRWDHEGRIKILTDLMPDGGSEYRYRVVVGEQYMADPDDNWPSVQLVARVALALEAGQGFPVFADIQIEDFKLDDPVRLTPAQWERLKLP